MQEMRKVVEMVNYELEYVLRPRTAPARGPGPPRLNTDRRARSSTGRRAARGQGGQGAGYPRVDPPRAASAHPLRPTGKGREGGRGRSQAPRPRTAPPRSPTRPNYKESCCYYHYWGQGSLGTNCGFCLSFVVL